MMSMGTRHEYRTGPDDPGGVAYLLANEAGDAVRHYVVRVNCEYRRDVQASSEDEAIEIAERVDLANWNQAWSDAEAEPA
jgi:hypothetical protein